MHRINLLERNYMTRENGLEMRKEILANYSKGILIDLKNINVITNSFADEAFGKLISEEGISRENLSKIIKFTNASDLVRNIIKKALIVRHVEINKTKCTLSLKINRT